MDACNTEGFSLTPTERDALSQVLLASYLAGSAGRARLRQEFSVYLANGFGSELLQPLLSRITKGVWREVEEVQSQALRDQVRIVSYFDEDYPNSLRQIADPPLVLFVRGRLPCGPAVAIVGSRRSTPYGERVAHTLSGFLAERSVVVVSGLARGIDAAAHAGSLAGIAVLGSGVMNIYPLEHLPLAERMLAAGGAIVSEYGLNMAPDKSFFPERNRLVSGLSSAVVIVEAEERSGALITARLANEQGREVFAVPGPIASPRSRGTHGLIRDGAQILCAYEDLFERVPVLAYAKKEPVRRRAANSSIKPAAVVFQGVELLAPPERLRAVAELLSDQLVHDFDGMLVRLGLGSGELTAVLSELELYGAIRVFPGRRFQYDEYVDMPEIFKQILSPA